MNKRFKPGPTKLRNGLEAYYYGEHEGRLYGRWKFKYGEWVSENWSRLGGNLDLERDGDWDLMPNVEPDKYTFECKWYHGAGHTMPMPVEHDNHARQCLEALRGRRTRVTIEVLDE